MPSLTAVANPTRGVPGRTDPPVWRGILATAVRRPEDLCRRLELPPSTEEEIRKAAAGFPLLVPAPYLERIRVGDPDDPLLRQVLPVSRELAVDPAFSADPLAEATPSATPGILRKYHGRVLVVSTGACAVHCRFCFRRHFPYHQSPRQAELWDAIVHRAASDPTLEEVILSGGDPLTLDDAVLAALAQRLAEIPHLRRIRVHTRVPVVIPQRVTDELLAWLRPGRLTSIVVLHINHPQEIDAALAAALARLVDAGIMVLNQAVLLRGVNDRAEVLGELCRKLVDLRVLPYYLHQLDRVAGAAHFEVPEDQGMELIRQLRARLPGYAVPRYVRETPGKPHKEVLE